MRSHHVDAHAVYGTIRFPIIKIMQTYLKSFHLTFLQRKAILYLAIMTHL